MKIKTIGIIAKNKDEAVTTTLKTLCDYFSQHPYEILLDTSAEGILDKTVPVVNRETLGNKCDLAIVIGGDGTFLSAVRSLSDFQLPILGINLGRLGFLVDISPDEMLDRLDEIFQGKYVDEKRFLLSAQVVRHGQVIHQATAFNDVVIHIKDVARMIEFETYINGQFVNFQRADGIVISTPTGSTAYALSSGGPLLHATLDAMVLVPICPHTLSNRPLVVDANSHVEIVIGENKQATTQVSFDGQLAYDVTTDDKILITRNANPVHLIHPANYDYYEILRAKLRWSEQL